jgi:hypothetical protein
VTFHVAISLKTHSECYRDVLPTTRTSTVTFPQLNSHCAGMGGTGPVGQYHNARRRGGQDGSLFGRISDSWGKRNGPKVRVTMSEDCRLLSDQALHEPAPFHPLCSQRVLPFPHLQDPVSGHHLRTVPVRTEDVGGSCGGLHLFPTAFHSAAVRTEEVA